MKCPAAIKHLAAAAAMLVLATAAPAAVGDLAWTACEPSSLPDTPRHWTLKYESVHPAPKNRGTVNPAAKVLGVDTHIGPIRMAIDSAAPDDKQLNLIRFDAVGAGGFDGRPTAPLRVQPSPADIVTTFGPVAVDFYRQGVTIPAVARGRCIMSGFDVIEFELSLGTCLEGQCAFGDKVVTVRFIDANCNRKVDDAPRPELDKGGTPLQVEPGDFVQVAAEDGKSFRTHYAGQPILVGGKWYEVKASADLSKVAATPLKLATAKLRIDAPQWTATLVGRDRILNLEGGKDPVALPAGKYAIPLILFRSGDEVGKVSNHNGGNPPIIDAAAGQTVAVAVGPPFFARVSVALKGREVTLNRTMTDSGGRPAWLSINDDRAESWFEIVDAAGKRVDYAAITFG